MTITTHQAGRRLQALMQQHGIDDARLSLATQVAKTNIFRLRNTLNANPTLATLKPLARYFGITVSQLIGELPLETADRPKGTVQHIPLLPWSVLTLRMLEGQGQWPTNEEIIVDARLNPWFACRLASDQWLQSGKQMTTVIFRQDNAPDSGDTVLVHLAKSNTLALRHYHDHVGRIHLQPIGQSASDIDTSMLYASVDFKVLATVSETRHQTFPR